MTPPRIARALRHRNYRLFFFGQGTSLIGTWLTRFAIGYETYALTHSAFMLGLVAFCSQAPTALVAPLAGVLVDRWDRHRTIVVTQVFALLQSAALAACALAHVMTVWHLMALGAVQAVINAFDMPARQSFVRQMVDDRADLPNALALNSSLVTVARMVGPVVAAVLLASVGAGGCFLVDAASYAAVIASLLAMRVAPQPPRVREGRVLDQMLAGLRYARGVPLVRDLLVLLLVTSALGSYNALLPAVAQGAMHGGPHTLGWLMGAAGAGALAAALVLAARERVAGLPRVIANSTLALGLGLMALELAPTVWAAVPVMFFVGGALVLTTATTNTLVQTLVDEDKLGRVMSLLAMVLFGGVPIGALLEGVLASVVGPVHAFAIAGAACAACSLALRHTLLGGAADPRPAVRAPVGPAP